jgi:hypothetical protein
LQSTTENSDGTEKKTNGIEAEVGQKMIHENDTSLPKYKRGRGVVYSAYSFDTNRTLPKYLEEAAVSAKQLKQNNPTIPIAIITNAKLNDVPSIFDQIIKVPDPMLFRSLSTRPDGIYRQWFTRAYYLAHSPFQITWYVDSHVSFLTTTLEQAMEDFEKKTDVDIAVANSQPNGFTCHNFAILYRWNDRVQKLFADWLFRQLQVGMTIDDQHTMCDAMACGGEQYGLKYGAISSQWALAWLSLNSGKDKEWWPIRTTRILSSAPQICHTPDVCKLGATGGAHNQTLMNKPRVLYMVSWKGRERIFYSQKELESSGLIPYKFVWDNWESQPTDIAVQKQRKCKPLKATIVKNTRKDPPDTAS